MNRRLSSPLLIALLATYLVTGVLSPKMLLAQSLFAKLDQSLSGQDQHSIVLDERPFWTSHKHLQSSERWSGLEAFPIPGVWSPVITAERLIIPGDHQTYRESPYFPSAALRAPPKP